MDFGEIYELYFKDIYCFALSLTKDEHMSEEITQETFFKALKAIDRFDGTKDIRAWLFTIARNVYYSQCRKQKKISPEELPEQIDSGIQFVEQIMDEESALLIHKFLHTMAEPYKEVFTLRVFGELPFEKIGVIFGKSPGWARVAFHRAKQQIADYMVEVHDERG